MRRVAAAGLAAALLLGACGPPPAGQRDLAVRLLGALPPEAVDRGVWLVDSESAGRLDPGSRALPLFGGAGTLRVETGPPPLTVVALGDDIEVFGAARDRAASEARLEAGAAPDGRLAALAAQDAPVRWAGPAPGGWLLVTAGPQEVVLRLEPSGDGPEPADVERALREGTLPGSPGKRWTDVLVDPSVFRERGDIVVRARPGGVEGGLLRTLVESQALAFLDV